MVEDASCEEIHLQIVGTAAAAIIMTMSKARIAGQ